MGHRWFRFYDDAINDPKILKLPEAMRWYWTAMLCVASKNNGLLPALDDVAIQLRVTAAKATEIIACLVKATLLDKTETGFAPHNWNGRQYKIDTADPTAASRSKRYRDRKRDDRDATVTDKRPESETEQIDRIGDAGASGGASAFTEGSKALASALWKALGFESPLSIPTEYAGTDWRAIEWERAGWTADLVDAVARQHGRKSLLYLEKCCATEFAKRQAPLPIVEIRSPETITVLNGKSQTRPGVAEIARRQAEHFENQARGGIEGDPDAVLCLPAR